MAAMDRRAALVRSRADVKVSRGTETVLAVLVFGSPTLESSVCRRVIMSHGEPGPGGSPASGVGEWLMVVVENQSTPVIWRVIQEGYPITTDEVSLWAGFAGRDNN